MVGPDAAETFRTDRVSGEKNVSVLVLHTDFLNVTSDEKQETWDCSLIAYCGKLRH